MISHRNIELFGVHRRIHDCGFIEMPARLVRRLRRLDRTLFGFVGEADFGFFVEDERADEAVRVAGARNVNSDRKNSCDALLEVGDVGGGGAFLFEGAFAGLFFDSRRGLDAVACALGQDR